MIHESQLEYCVIAEYSNGDKFCIAKFMHEEDAKRYRSVRRRSKKEYVEWKLYERCERMDGVTWKKLE